MARKRRIFNAPFKAKVAIEAIKGHRTISELTGKHKLHATQINLWKKQLLDGAETIFENGNGKKAKPADTDEPSSVSPDDSNLPTRQSLNTRVIPEKIPGVRGLAM